MPEAYLEYECEGHPVHDEEADYLKAHKAAKSGDLAPI